jgi:CBS domain-containing protein
VKVKDVMEKAVFVSPTDSKKKLLAIARKHPKVRLFLVVGKNKKFLGDVHENDLFLMLLPNRFYEFMGLEEAFYIEKMFYAKNVRDIMRKHDFFCYADEHIRDVALKSSKLEVNEMPVLNRNHQVVGCINQGTLLRHMKVIT